MIKHYHMDSSRGEWIRECVAMETEDDLPTDLELLEWIDPEWRKHFAGDVQIGIDFYKMYAPEEVIRALEEMDQ